MFVMLTLLCLYKVKQYAECERDSFAQGVNPNGRANTDLGALWGCLMILYQHCDLYVNACDVMWMTLYVFQ